MKRFLLVLVLSANAFAISDFFITASGGAPVPDAYSTSNSQSQIKVLPVGTYSCCAYNDMGATIALAPGPRTSVPPSTGQNLYIPDGKGLCENFYVPGALYLRMKGSADTAGDVMGHCERIK